MTKKVNGSVQGREEYWYDEKNARYLVVKRDANDQKTGAIWFIEDTEAHYNATGTVTRAFGHVSMGTPVARLDRSSDAASTLEYQFHGLANNTLATVQQATGVTNASFVYAPFGEIIEATNDGGATNGLPVHRRRMNDKFVDEASGLSYFGFRYLDRLSMTWTQGDPVYRFAPDRVLSQPRRALLYTSALNNSLRYLDPDGRNPIFVAELARRGALVLAALFLASPKPDVEHEPEPIGTSACPPTICISRDKNPTLDVYPVPNPDLPSSPEDLAPDIRHPMPEAAPFWRRKPGSGKRSDGVPEPVDPEGDKTTEVPPLPNPPAPKLPPAKIRKIPRGLPPPRTPNAPPTSGGSSSSNSGGAHKPADANGDGSVTDEEESSWMRSVQ